ncbi:hypothetical protein HG536_0E05520 [Torulaspora globosa]|uniref:WAC domain-containing protein n=1 Tax=Torulaspora globosa TaxID=48254 RepID=A0A7G3ZJF5_9SACH|nr:uncharacterized protein HG536_0E05520 [Torulaspora globosa]QLL33641.1 hypothetical protein HG536_0E05520 [Torulaspora globosa]
MVLYKRKPVTLPDPEVLPADLNIEVWHIDETGEWFASYEKYLERLDFYSRHHFTCEITGTSCLTFFEALDSEETQFRLVEEKFPLKLREPVARFLHFNGIKRLDALVETTYVRFKNDFFPGEVVYLRKGNKEVSAPSSNHSTPQPDESFFKGHKETATEAPQPQYQRPYIIKEKAQFNATTDSVTGEIIVPAYSKYMLTEGSHGNKSLIADQSQIYRDRSTFTKHLIKCFCKITLRRASSKMGAPWAVKDEYLPMYGLTMDWPPEMLKYKEDEIPNEKGRKQRSIEDTDENEHESGTADRENTDDLDIEELGSVSSKRRKVGEDIRENHAMADASATGSITSILEDLCLPYQGPPKLFPSVFQYNQYLELIQLENNIPFRPFQSMGKLLQVFQFLSSFGPTLLLSHFTLDQFLTTLKCTDPQELKGEAVHVELDADGEKSEKKKQQSDWERSWPIRATIRNMSTPIIHYTIVKDEPASEGVIDDVNNNGSGLLIEIFCALLRMFVDESGDWSFSLPEDWLQEDIQKTNQMPSENESQELSSSTDDQANSLELALEKCLDYRNVNWAERLSKRQFNNGHWLVILLGILTECVHIPLYKELIDDFNQKVIPENISSTQLPKQLWRNFCSNLSFKEKVDVIWILVDVLTNYSPDIKTAVDSSLELCGLIRSERFRVGKDLKSEALVLNQLRVNLQTAEDANQEEVILEQLRNTVAQQESRLADLQNDKMFLDQKVMEHDIQRLRPLGLDRYCNRYYWLDLSGVPSGDPSASINGEDTRNIRYHSGRLWIQGPTREAVKFHLRISDDELDKWLNLAKEAGKERATEEVFHISMKDDGSYIYSEKGSETQLVDKDGLANTLIDLMPIQKKVIDETPKCLLLSDTEWYSVDRVEDLRRLGDWLDTWGRREHDLLRQLGTLEKEVQEAYKVREEQISFYQYDEVESKLFREFEESKLSESELKYLSERNESAQENNELDEESALKDEEELETIADEIMKLDDCSQTRQIADKVKELEERRDLLLERRQLTENEPGPGSRVQARTERKRLNNVLDLKLARQARILTDLLNHRHFNAIENVVQWKNDLAIRYYGTSLRKNAAGSTKEPIADSVDEKLKQIISQTSRTTTAAVAN